MGTWTRMCPSGLARVKEASYPMGNILLAVFFMQLSKREVRPHSVSPFASDVRRAPITCVSLQLVPTQFRRLVSPHLLELMLIRHMAV
jgi:hypothetical protein